MDFETDGRLTAFRERGRRVGRALVKPSLTSRDRSARWDPELFIGLTAEGVPGAPLPEDSGGLGATALETVFLLEGFGAGSGDMGLSSAIGAHGVLCGVSIAVHGSIAQKRRYLAPMASGAWLGAVCPSTVDGHVRPAVQAREDHSGWMLDGSFPAVVNAPDAHHFLTIATGPGGVQTAFLIDREVPGVVVREAPVLTALRTSRTAEVVLEECAVSADAVLGTPGCADAELIPLLAALERTCLLAPWLGLLREMSLEVVDLVSVRPVLARSQSARMAAVDLRTRTELAADLLYRAAWQLDALDRPPRENAAMAKTFLVEALDAATRTVATLGGHSPGRPPTPAYRDALNFAAADGAGVTLRSVVADSLLRKN
ncbi:acyl-CoA dehydrogenase family protein [Amycolatopsis sp. NPDC049868]|uniref:acyl-CoA dehydrogenase family protein n=1 Tax=Amycolatopsis sp. NPDC049868 TaxID=3363934 RepID=UPI0037B243E6